MTMHVVLGDGEMPIKELHAHLADLRSKDTEADQPFWFLVQAKAEPTAVDQALMKWLHDNEIYYETIGDGSEVSDIYANAQQRYEVKRLAPKIVNLMKSVPEDGEEAQLLALFVSEDPDAEEDRWLNDVISAVSEADFKVLSLQDGLSVIDFEEVEGGEELEEEVVEDEVVEPTPITAKKSVAKKAAAAAAPTLSREELEDMDITQLKALAGSRGITLPPRTRMATYVEALLGEIPEPAEAEIEPEEIDTGVSTTPETIEVTETVIATDFPITGPAMVIVVNNGMVTSKVVSPKRAAELLAGA